MKDGVPAKKPEPAPPHHIADAARAKSTSKKKKDEGKKKARPPTCLDNPDLPGCEGLRAKVKKAVNKGGGSNKVMEVDEKDTKTQEQQRELLAAEDSVPVPTVAARTKITAPAPAPVARVRSFIPEFPTAARRLSVATLAPTRDDCYGALFGFVVALVVVLSDCVLL